MLLLIVKAQNGFKVKKKASKKDRNRMLFFISRDKARLAEQKLTKAVLLDCVNVQSRVCVFNGFAMNGYVAHVSLYTSNLCVYS